MKKQKKKNAVQSNKITGWYAVVKKVQHQMKEDKYFLNPIAQTQIQPYTSPYALKQAIYFCCEWMTARNWDYLIQMCKKCYPHLKAPGKENSIFWMESESWKFTLGKMLGNYIYEKLDKELIRELTLGFNHPDFLENAYRQLFGLDQNTIDCVIKTILSEAESVRENNTSEYTFCFCFLYLWTYGIESNYIDSFLRNYPMPGEGISKQKESLETAFRFECSFDDSEYIKSIVKKIRSRLNEHFSCKTEEAYGLESFVASALSLESSLEVNSNYDKLRLPLSICHIAKILDEMGIYLIPHFLNQPSTLKRISEIIDDVIKMHLMNFYEQEFLDVRDNHLPDTIQPGQLLSPDGTLFVPMKKVMSERDISGYVRDIDLNVLLASCIWAAAMDIVVTHAKEDNANAAIYFYTSKVMEDKASELGVDKLKKRVAQLEEVLEKHPEEEIETLIAENRRLKAENAALSEKVSDIGSQIEKMTFPIQESLKKAEDKLRSRRKKLNQMEQDLKHVEAERDALEEKIAELEKLRRTPSEENSYIQQVDPNKKYLFVINDDTMRYKIKAWFPNSVLADNLEINRKNCKSFYMAIFITKSIGHREYFRIKNKCINYIPELSDSTYSRQDFLDLCNNQENLAEECFYAVDWQHPETWIEDQYREDEWGWCPNCNRIVDMEGERKPCPICGSELRQQIAK